MTRVFSTADKALARRIEAGHAASGLAFAGAASQRGPDITTATEPVAGGWAIFQGTDLPMTQALNVGMHGPVSAEELDRLQTFFHDRGSPAVIDLCTLADPTLLTLVQQRGYVVREITNVLALGLDATDTFPNPPGEVAVEDVETGGTRDWSRMVAQGFSETEDVPEQFVDMLAPSAPTVRSYYGLHQGTRCATAAMDIHDGLSTLFGDATLTYARGRGLQLALIRARLADAVRLNCDLASASVAPGAASHRNYQRAGFQLLYARVMVSLPKPIS